MVVPAKPFVPPAPRPRTHIPGYLEILRTVYRNPLELWGEPSYNERWIHTRFINERALIVNDPGLIRHILVDNAGNYRMGTIRQLVLRPILRDGLLTAEGECWRRSRRAMAPVFTPRHINGFAGAMLERSRAFAARYEDRAESDIATDMTELTFDILSRTLFSGDVVTTGTRLASEVNRLLSTMGRIDPLDFLKAPAWLPRITRIRGRRSLDFFHTIVSDTIAARRSRIDSGDSVPDDFLTLLLRQEGANGLTAAEIEDNIITFIGAGHETTARALAWTLYCLANSPRERDRVEEEIDRVLAEDSPPALWAERMPCTRAAIEEAMRLYPPAPSINRAAIANDRWGEVEIPAGITVLITPWTLHRHRRLWEHPDAFMPERFLPEHRDRIDRYQYLPFGAGPRVCIGASFAIQEAIIALTTLMSHFRFDCTERTRPWPVQKLTVQPEGGIPMRITRR